MVGWVEWGKMGGKPHLSKHFRKEKKIIQHFRINLPSETKQRMFLAISEGERE